MVLTRGIGTRCYVSGGFVEGTISIIVNGGMVANGFARLACKSYIPQEEPFIQV